TMAVVPTMAVIATADFLATVTVLATGAAAGDQAAQGLQGCVVRGGHYPPPPPPPGPQDSHQFCSRAVLGLIETLGLQPGTGLAGLSRDDQGV
ncbi:hypothetical protein, partial [Nocardia cyriacigeorgica]|uniref:hypothetical protein n=1 Tax=Nocardia cyriacigeorgica TaxID=135487 RepID=UPI0024537FF4